MDSSRQTCETIEDVYGKCGIILAHLTDPLSLLINKIIGIKEGDPNAVGIYYEAKSFGSMKCIVLLFNVYDNSPIPWCKLGTNMEYLLCYPFITRVTFYSLTNNHGLFRTTSIKVMGNNTVDNTKDKSYATILMKAANLHNGTLTTGYTLVNTILLSMMGKTPDDDISSKVISCSLLKEPVSYSQKYMKVDNKYIIEETKKEIISLMATFIDLLTTNDDFQNNILRAKTTNTENIQDLRKFITNIIDSFDEDKISAIDVGELVAFYNSIALDQIVIDKKEHKSKLAMVTLSENIIISPSPHYIVPNLYPNLAALSKKQLSDLLLYISSLTDNIQDTRYCVLQNKIIVELSSREE